MRYQGVRRSCHELLAREEDLVRGVNEANEVSSDGAFGAGAGDSSYTPPTPTPGATANLCMDFPDGFCPGGSATDIPFMQVVNKVKAGQDPSTEKCVGWARDGVPSAGDDADVVNCMIKDPKTGEEIPNPRSLFRPVYPSVVQLPYLGDTRVTRLVPMDVKDAKQNGGTCSDWVTDNKGGWFDVDTPAPAPATSMGQTDSGCGHDFAGPFVFEQYQPAEPYQQFVFSSNYPDACALTNRRCGTTPVGSQTGNACDLGGGSWSEPSYLNFNGPNGLNGVVPACPPKLQPGSHRGIHYPGSLGANIPWVSTMPNGGKMPDGGPNPAAFALLRYGVIHDHSCNSNTDCSGGQGGTCEEDSTTGRTVCTCKDPNAVGDCGSCKDGYSMDKKTITCVKIADPKKSKGFLGLSTKTWIYIGGGAAAALLLWWAVSGDKEKEASPQESYFDE